MKTHGQILRQNHPFDGAPEKNECTECQKVCHKSYAVVGLAICKPCGILADSRQGTKKRKGTWGGESQAGSLRKPN